MVCELRTNQVASISLSGEHERINFYDGHLLQKIKCIGEPCELLLHAEIYMVSYCAREGIALQDSTLILYELPCMDCARVLLNTGIAHITYITEQEQNGAFEMLAVKIPLDYMEGKSNASKRSSIGASPVKRQSRRRTKAIKEA